MIIDAQSLPDGSSIEADFCMIGGGMVALALVRELATSGASLAILESGGEAPVRATQDLYIGTGTLRGPVGASRDISDYLHQSRARYFGGSGNVWGGKCGVLERVDFDRRPWMPNSGWPFGRDVLDPYYDRACDLLEIPRLTQDMERLVSAERPVLQVGDGGTLTTQARHHTQFTGTRGTRYDEMKRAATDPPNVRVYLNANVTSLNLTPSGEHLSDLTLRCLNGRTHRADAKRYLLATGGLENVRLLLQSTSVQPQGVGNAHDLVGRYFSGHVNFSFDEGAISGVAFTRRSQPFDLYVDGDPSKTWGIVATTRDAQRARRLPNFWGTFVPMDGATDAPTDAAAASWQLFDEGPRATATADFYPIRFMVELEAHAESRLTLSEQTDALQQRRLHLDWRLTQNDYDGLRRSIALFASTLGAEAVGRLRWPVNDEQLVTLANPARHHLGTTRMHSDPRRGVVDENCRVHGIDNLWVGGSSVFPTGGVANPTLTIMALTLRLADQIRPLLRS